MITENHTLGKMKSLIQTLKSGPTFTSPSEVLPPSPLLFFFFFLLHPPTTTASTTGLSMEHYETRWALSPYSAHLWGLAKGSGCLAEKAITDCC